MIGIPMPDRIFEEVGSPNLAGDGSISDALITRVRVYFFVPPSTSDLYADAVFAEYKLEMK
jgi:hypothetical protein